MQQDLVLYVYRCTACGYRGELRLEGDAHDGEQVECRACGAKVVLEWDGGVVLRQEDQEG